MSRGFAVRINLVVQEVIKARRRQLNTESRLSKTVPKQTRCLCEFLSSRINCTSKWADFFLTRTPDYRSNFLLGSFPCYFSQDGQPQKEKRFFEQKFFGLQKRWSKTIFHQWKAVLKHGQSDSTAVFREDRSTQKTRIKWNFTVL